MVLEIGIKILLSVVYVFFKDRDGVLFMFVF